MVVLARPCRLDATLATAWGATDIDPLITAIIATPGTVRLALTGGVTVRSSFKPAQL